MGVGAPQWTRLSNPAARAATIATAYWIASMMRSSPGSAVSAVHVRSCGSIVSVSMSWIIVSNAPCARKHGTRPPHRARITTRARSARSRCAARLRAACNADAHAGTHDRCATPSTVVMSQRTDERAARAACRRKPQEVLHAEANLIDPGDGRGPRGVLAVRLWRVRGDIGSAGPKRGAKRSVAVRICFGGAELIGRTLVRDGGT
jgi:hypothetical protein